MELVSELKRLRPLSEVILLTAHGNIPDGVQAIKNGAFDYIRNKAESNATKLQLMIDLNDNARVYRFYYDKAFFADEEMTFLTQTWQKILCEIGGMEI